MWVVCLLDRVLWSLWELLLRMILDSVAENRGVQVEFYTRFQHTIEVSDHLKLIKIPQSKQITSCSGLVMSTKSAMCCGISLQDLLPLDQTDLGLLFKKWSNWLDHFWIAVAVLFSPLKMKSESNAVFNINMYPVTSAPFLNTPKPIAGCPVHLLTSVKLTVILSSKSVMDVFLPCSKSAYLNFCYNIWFATLCALIPS